MEHKKNSVTAPPFSPSAFSLEITEVRKVSWPVWRDDVADFLDTRNVRMFNLMHVIAGNRETLADLIQR